jgi:heptosyltransferase II
MAEHILIVGPAWVGDMVMAQCLFKLLKQEHPSCVIDVLAMPAKHGELNIGMRYRLGRSLRKNSYTQAIVLPNSFKSAWVPVWAHIPKRTGFTGEMRYGLLNDRRSLYKKQLPLMVQRFMALGLEKNATLPANYPIPELKADKASQALALEKHQLTLQRPVLALCPGAEFGPAKRWPEGHYAEVAKQKLHEGWEVWIFGSAKDQPVAETIMAMTDQQCINLAGRTRLDEAIDLLALATAVVSNDSGLMHISAALQKPLVAVYGPTSASFTPPLHDKAKILTLALSCQPCFERECPLKHQQCMRDLVPQRVLAALNELGV